MREVKGKLDGKGKRIAIVISKFNEFVSKELLSGCIDELKLLGVDDANIETYFVEGSFEIPLALKVVSQRRSVDGMIALGVILRGETSHFDYIAKSVIGDISKISQDTGIPIALGVLTPDDIEQAISRAGGKAGNKGREAARVCINMINLVDSI
ncbi:MAG: 6,7-dimethyl-8-ribityllumazine synthase [Caldiserica bacterium]|nr:MAG: 6,7-dimethyl-8-ribityllumazine synthase [Caldisericota bacterium]